MCSFPFAWGGLRTVEDVREVLRAGADKVAINTEAIRRPDFIREASLAFGSSTIVVSIEAIRRENGSWEALVEYGRETTGVDALDWARKVEELGAGELLITSIDKEGTGRGFDLELLEAISTSVSIPVIGCGGCGRPEHVVDALVSGRADAVCLAAALHYNALAELLEKSKSHDYEQEGNIEFLKARLRFSQVSPCTIDEIKSAMMKNGLACRTVHSHA